MFIKVFDSFLLVLGHIQVGTSSQLSAGETLISLGQPVTAMLTVLPEAAFLPVLYMHFSSTIWKGNNAITHCCHIHKKCTVS